MHVDGMGEQEAAAMPFKRTETGLESVLAGVGKQIHIKGQKRLKKANSEIGEDGVLIHRGEDIVQHENERKTIVITMIEISKKFSPFPQYPSFLFPFFLSFPPIPPNLFL